MKKTKFYKLYRFFFQKTQNFESLTLNVFQKTHN